METVGKKCEAKPYRKIQTPLLVRLIAIIRAIKGKKVNASALEIPCLVWKSSLVTVLLALASCTVCPVSLFGCALLFFTTFTLLNASTYLHICLDNFVFEIFATVKINASTFRSISSLNVCVCVCVIWSDTATFKCISVEWKAFK